MDLALAHLVTGAFKDKKIDLDPWQSVSLWHACRTAKETLFAAGGPKKHPVTILGRGSKLIGGTISVDLDRKAASALLLDGFFPACELTDKPAQKRASGFRELGLPFESDTAITRHLAAFLAAHGDPKSGPVRPTHLLFNGGVFKADMLRERLVDVMGSWFGAKAAPEMPRRKWRSRSGGRPRGGLLRRSEARPRHSHPRRHGPVVLRRHRDGRAGNSRRGSAAAGVVRRTVRDGRRHGGRRARGGDRRGRW